jgi:hypothetical protein
MVDLGFGVEPVVAVVAFAESAFRLPLGRHLPQHRNSFSTSGHPARFRSRSLRARYRAPRRSLRPDARITATGRASLYRRQVG